MMDSKAPRKSPREVITASKPWLTSPRTRIRGNTFVHKALAEALNKLGLANSTADELNPKGT